MTTIKTLLATLSADFVSRLNVSEVKLLCSVLNHFSGSEFHADAQSLRFFTTLCAVKSVREALDCSREHNALLVTLLSKLEKLDYHQLSVARETMLEAAE